MSDMPQTAPAAPQRRLSLPEFTAMLASLTATVAFSIDAMLPALPQIAADLSPQDVNRAQLVLTSFVLGMGLGTFFAGPVSDAIGRRRTLFLGIAIYIAGALGALVSNSLEVLLIARFVQGFGSAGPRIVPMALVRDLYAGREMAKITSFIMMLFILVPAMAPSVGGLIIGVTGWHGVFGAFVIFGLIGGIWVALRQPETLAPERRRPLRLAALIAGAREVVSDRNVRLYTMVMALGFGQMFALLSSSQQLFAVYGVTESFPNWFALMAILAGSGTVFNARFVMRLGMRKIVKGAYIAQIAVSSVMLGLLVSGWLAGPGAFPLILIYAISVFAMAGLTFGNLNALAMQKMGHLAGMTASVVTALSTVGAVLIAAPVGLAFNGTALPIILATLGCSVIAWGLMRRTDDLA
ncbi:MAG: multidrug effflux MFS transporter [Sphingomonadales bacterium]|nr:multidrug effflux MFS transporter [Sphingomonadales bacterium]